MLTESASPLGLGDSDGMFHFEATDVTENLTATATVQATLPVAEVTTSLVAEMKLPSSVPYGLRDELTGALLDDEESIAEQLKPGAQVTVVPKTHLGGKG